MEIEQSTKHPQASITHTFNWETYKKRNIGIVSSSFSADAGISLSNDLLVAHSASVRVSGGEDGKSYMLSNTVQLDNGDTDVYTIRINVEII